MLHNINISNLDNSISQTSYYSDAYENSVQLEEHYQKKNEQNQISNPNKNKDENNNNNNNNNDKNIYSNTNFVENNIENNNKNKNKINTSNDSSNSEVYESVIDEQSRLENIDNMKSNKIKVNEINDKPKSEGNLRYIKNNVIENNETIDILKYNNDKMRLFYDNKFDLNNQNKINEIINNKNINNVNLSNINIIINKSENYKSKKNSKKEINSNLSSIDEGKKINNLSVNSTLSNRSSSIDIKKEKKSQKSNRGNNTSNKKKEAENNSKDNDINSEDEIYSKISDHNSNEKNENNSNLNSKGNIGDINENLNINEVTKSKAIDSNDKRSNVEKTDTKLSSFKKFNNSINTNNLDMESFDSVTVIKKKKKKNFNNNISKLSNSYNDNSSFLSFANSILVNTIKFDGIKKDEIDLTFLSNLRTLDITYKKREQKKYLKTLLELQHFFIDEIGSAIRVIKISEDGKYLSAGMQCGKIILFEIIGYDFTKFEASYNAKNVMKYLNFINEKPFKTLKGHSQDVLGLDWSTFDHNLLLSCSTDKFIILWDVSLSEENCKIQSFDHGNIVTCVSFSPTDKFKFASGCLDKFIRIWDFRDILDKFYNNNNNSNIESQNDAKIIDSELKNLKKLKKYIFQYFNIEEKITAISFYPSGDKIVIGTHNGKIIIYEIRSDNCFYKASFNCRNRIGKNSMGKKITSIEFLNKNYSVISSSDSRIRLISMNDGKLIHKYKGYTNENSWIKSSIDYNYDVIITGSEDGLCYVWNLYNEEKKNLNYESFKPYSHEVVHCSLIVPEKCYCNFLKKIMKLTHKLLITSIIINGTNRGRLEILLNIEGKC